MVLMLNVVMEKSCVLPLEHSTSPPPLIFDLLKIRRGGDILFLPFILAGPYPYAFSNPAGHI